MYRSKRDGVDINIFIIQLVILFLNCPVDNFVYYFYFLVNKCVDLIRALYFLKFSDLFLIVFCAILRSVQNRIKNSDADKLTAMELLKQISSLSISVGNSIDAETEKTIKTVPNSFFISLKNNQKTN